MRISDWSSDVCSSDLGSTPVRVRGLHDGEFAYLLFEWPDATRSQKHLPLQKTESCWRVLQSDYARQDENVFYEDKFAVMLSRDSHLAALHSSHLGAQPLEIGRENVGTPVPNAHIVRRL